MSLIANYLELNSGEKLESKLYKYILFLFGGSLPLGIPSTQWSSFLASILFSIVIYDVVKNKHKVNRPIFSVVLLFSGFYFVHVVWLVGSDNISQAYFELEKKLSLVLLPIALIGVTRLKGSYKLVLRGFVIGCVLASIICFTNAIFDLVVKNDSSQFEYHKFSEIVNIQPGYFSAYLCLAVSILVAKTSIISNSRLLAVTALAIMSMTVIVLSARMQIFLLCMILLFSMVAYLKKLSFMKSLGFLIATSLVLLVIIFSFPQNRYRLKEALNADPTRWGEKQVRGSIWPCAIETIEGSSFFGVGTGDVRDEMEKCYIKRGYTSLTYWQGLQFNAHNQYLEIALGLGIIGLVYFLSMIVYVCYLFLKAKNILGYYLMFIILTSCVTESILERQRGILLFTTFIPLLIFQQMAQNQVHEKTLS